ncbi:hypothetical protein [Micromonospora sp. SL4-19]|uniref:hypothetical protein n=1 Tax=Micromonospora sp. SL4-19 TaxID=3399129 RepID=UPI003A4D6307
MSVILRHEGGIYVPMVEATAKMPLPPLPDSQRTDAGNGEPIEWLELLTVHGPPSVVASALDALGAHLDELVPLIGKLYDDHEEPQHGG